MIQWENHIEADARVLLGKSVIRGTRISVELLLELFGSGWTAQQILDSYPQIQANDLKAVFIYLKECIQEELFFSPAPKR